MRLKLQLMYVVPWALGGLRQRMEPHRRSSSRLLGLELRLRLESLGLWLELRLLWLGSLGLWLELGLLWLELLRFWLELFLLNL